MVIASLTSFYRVNFSDNPPLRFAEPGLSFVESAYLQL